jgi:hypothetical protein
VSRHFRGLKSDNLLNFSVAMTVMAVQRKWRARMKVVNLRRKKEARAARGLSVPSWEDTVAMRYRLLKAAWGQRQVGVKGGCGADHLGVLLESGAMSVAAVVRRQAAVQRRSPGADVAVD